ncbi:MAG: glycosyltransferase family 1 protein [Pseudomonadota bacterium]|nr:glycosyltransferase family 1 protein [Pseudomonadota bacterium]
MRIAIVTDAWHPQINGVVTTLSHTCTQLQRLGHELRVITPGEFPTLALPTYRSIRVALCGPGGVARLLRDFTPDAVHIATEGPLGHAARRWCLRQSFPFTTSYHTQFPEYLRLRVPVPLELSYAYLRRFHAQAARTLVPTPQQAQLLRDRGFEHLVLWPRGVDTELFRPDGEVVLDLPRPVLLYLGRVAVEKNVQAFLDLNTPGSKLVIGDGPDRRWMQQRHPDVHFAGFKTGTELAQLIAACDLLVFPSLTDTFGLVMLEAMACGLPVAAFPVTGPIDVVQHGVTGALDADLGCAVAAALQIDPAACVRFARSRSWQQASSVFLNQLQPAHHHRQPLDRAG